MSTSPVPFDSDALRANIASTAQEVVIPDRYLPLVDAVAGPPRRARLARRDPGRVLPHLPQRRPAHRRLPDHPAAQLDLLRAFRGPRRAVRAALRAGARAARHAALRRAVLAAAARPPHLVRRRPCGGPHADAYDEPLLQPLGESLARLLPRHPARVPGARHPPAATWSRRRPSGRRWRPSSSSSIARVLLLGYRRVQRPPRRPRLGETQGDGLTDAGGRRRPLRLPGEAAHRRRSPRAPRRSAGAKLLSPELPALLRPPRPGHRPGLPGREPRGPLRRLPLLPQGRHAGLPAERGHGRPAGRRPAADEARAAHGRRTASSAASPASSATATTSSC